jgi:peroxidase
MNKTLAYLWKWAIRVSFLVRFEKKQDFIINNCFFFLFQLQVMCALVKIISITSWHVVFLREHNAIAERLQKMNPQLNDRTLFEETRRIVAAVLQHITYKKYLPLIVGSHTVERFKLQPMESGYSLSYDPYVNPSISNEFSGAAYRFGHSAVARNFQ